MKSINRDLPDDLNQLFQEWKSFPSNDSLEGLASFLAQHPAITGGECKPLLYAILADLYGTDYLSGTRMSVNQYLKKFTEWENQASLELDQDELIRHCLEVYFHVSAQEPDIEDLCLSYPSAEDFILDFAEKNRDWLFPSQNAAEGGRLALGEQESISEDYKILEMIGHGGQKEVYTVTQQSTGQTLALKVPSREDGGKEEFISEANIQAGLSHQGIPAVFSLAFGPDTPTRLVERYIDGTSWANIFSDQTQEENIQILERTSRILASAHLEHHVIHGDVKPLNVMINPKYNEIYLVDWGMAIHLDRKPDRLIPRGTMDYLPPEIANGEIGKVCMATDVFMLGAVLYHILAGCAPYSTVFTNVGPFDAMICASEGRWPALPEMGQYGPIPQELREIVAKAMAFEPSDRYHDAGQFADALTKYLKRSKLLDRYEKAKECNESIRARYQSVGKKHRDRALLLADAIGNVNDFALIRRDLAETEKDSPEKSALLRGVFHSELTARQFLLEKTISMKDYAQATAQLETERESVASCRESFGPESSYEAFIQKADHDIRFGLGAQRLDYCLKWVTLGMILLVLTLVTVGAYREAKQAREKADLAQKLLENETERVNFEKKVFPLSIDYSYMEAFVAPLLEFERGKHCVIIAAMPKDYRELGNSPREKKMAIKQDLEDLGWTCESKEYAKDGWTRKLTTDVIKPGGEDIPGTIVYVDVVSQLSAVKKVLDYLTENNPFHSIEDREDLAKYYVEEFETELLELLRNNPSIEGCSWEIRFVTDKRELEEVLKGITAPHQPSEEAEKPQ